MSDVEKLKLKIDDWTQRLHGEDYHAIGWQIVEMLRRSAFYRSVNESRRHLPVDGEGNKKANGYLHELLDSGYITMHGTTVRRLLEDGQTNGPRGVNSLYGLIRDIKDSVEMLTRENVLQARGYVYDYEPIEQRCRQEAWDEAAAKGERAFFVSQQGWADSKYWHETMDELCGTVPEKRSPHDRPPVGKFDTLLESLRTEGSVVSEYVNKYVAHSATQNSRATLSPDQQSMSLAKLWVAERVIVRVANFISRSFVTGSNPFGVPVTAFDPFQYMDHPFVERTAKDDMKREWDRHSDEIWPCRNWKWDQPVTDASDVWPDSPQEAG